MKSGPDPGGQVLRTGRKNSPDAPRQLGPVAMSLRARAPPLGADRPARCRRGLTVPARTNRSGECPGPGSTLAARKPIHTRAGTPRRSRLRAARRRSRPGRHSTAVPAESAVIHPRRLFANFGGNVTRPWTRCRPRSSRATRGSADSRQPWPLRRRHDRNNE
jgi:hypothetical protein